MFAVALTLKNVVLIDLKKSTVAAGVAFWSLAVLNYFCLAFLWNLLWNLININENTEIFLFFFLVHNVVNLKVVVGEKKAFCYAEVGKLDIDSGHQLSSLSCFISDFNQLGPDLKVGESTEFKKSH